MDEHWGESCPATLALAGPDTSIQKIARIVGLDVGICTKILQLVNSAFFGVARSVTNIQNAVSYLGMSTRKSLILSVEVFRACPPTRPLEGFCLENLQQHARLTAYIAARLAVPHHLRDIAMVAGMLRGGPAEETFMGDFRILLASLDKRYPFSLHLRPSRVGSWLAASLGGDPPAPVVGV